MYETEIFRVTQKTGENVAVQSESGSSSYAERLICASGLGDRLLITLADSGNVYHSVLLDERCEELADMAGQCELLPGPNGEPYIYMDDRQGHILRTEVRTLDDLRNEADGRKGIG